MSDTPNTNVPGAETARYFDLLDRGQHDDLLEALDAAPADGIGARARDRWGCSLLYYAAGKGDMGLIDGLLARGAEADRSSDAGNTPLMLAAARGNLEAVRRLLAAGADPEHANRWGYDARRWADWAPNAAEVQAELFAAAG
jgi:ankyrin repeat protein